MQKKDELPPIDFEGQFEGYDAFDPRAFWEKVAVKDRAGKQPKKPEPEEGPKIPEGPKK